MVHDTLEHLAADCGDRAQRLDRSELQAAFAGHLLPQLGQLEQLEQLHARGDPSGRQLGCPEHYQPGCRYCNQVVYSLRMSRSGADLALLLLGGFRSLADAASVELAERGHEKIRPVHDFAIRSIDAGADTASELGRQLGVSKQAAA